MIRFSYFAAIVAIFVALLSSVRAQDDDEDPVITKQVNACIEECHINLGWGARFFKDIQPPSNPQQPSRSPLPSVFVLPGPTKTPQPDFPAASPKPSLAPDPCYDKCVPSEYFCYCRRSECLPNGMCICKKYVCKRDVNREKDRRTVVV